MSTDGRVDHLELLRVARRSAGDQRKVLLTVYGLLLFVPVVLIVIAIGRAVLYEGFFAELQTTFLRPAVATVGLFRGALAAGAWGLMGGVLIGIWLAAMLVGSFFGLAVTRMAAVELCSDRRAEVGEAIRFARSHWYWAFLTPACLLVAAIALLGLGAGLLALGRISELLLVVAAPCALILGLGAVVIIFGLVAGGGLAWSTIATEWSDAFDAITRVYGYSFAHSYRVLIYRIGAFLALCGAVISRAFRAFLALGGFYLALIVGLGRERTNALFDAALLEPPGGPPLPQTIAGWTLVACVAIFLTMLVARLLVFRLVLRQGIYLLLRLRVDRVPMDNIDGYRPDDSAFDPTAQGFELVEVEEELPAE